LSIPSGERWSIPNMSDWGTFAAAGVTGITASVVTFISARYNRRGELDRLKQQVSSERREQRRIAYHDFLNQLDPFNKVISGEAEMTEAEFRLWEDGFHSTGNALRLFGTREVVMEQLRLAGNVVLIYALFGDEDDYLGDPPPFETQLAQGCGTVRDNWFDAYRTMVTAMRADVAPDLGDHPDVEEVTAYEANRQGSERSP
jgi:hypothetical protein